LAWRGKLDEISAREALAYAAAGVVELAEQMANKAFADYVKDLAVDWSKISSLESPADVIDVLRGRMETWIGPLQGESSKYIDDLAVLTRDRVQHDYYLPLWLSHLARRAALEGVGSFAPRVEATKLKHRCRPRRGGKAVGEPGGGG